MSILYLSQARLIQPARFGRKKENQPAEQKGHTTDNHRNANRIHFESSKEYRSGSFEDRKGRNAPFFETSFTAHLGGCPSAADPQIYVGMNISNGPVRLRDWQPEGDDHNFLHSNIGRPVHA
jgi:hypothetical protein